MLKPPITPAWELGLEPDWILVAPAEGHTLYRLVGHSDARLRDFESDRDKNEALPDSKKRPRWPDQSYIDYLGVSMFETKEIAEESAVKYPKLIVSVRLDRQNGFTIARTEADIAGHYTVWGDAQALLDSVAGPVSRYDRPE